MKMKNNKEDLESKIECKIEWWINKVVNTSPRDKERKMYENVVRMYAEEYKDITGHYYNRKVNKEENRRIKQER